MTGDHETRTVGGLPTPGDGRSRLPAALTRAAWLLWVVSLGVSAVWLRRGGPRVSVGPVAVDGLTVLMWTVVTFFGGIVHSYSRRYMAGERDADGFFGRVFAFTLVVMVLVAADGLALFWAAWLAMGLVMAGLVGHGDWPQAQAAGALARRYFLASSALLAVGLAALFRAVPAARTVVVLAGAGYLTYLGVRTLGGSTADAEAKGTDGNPFLQGLTVNVLNPQVALFFLAFLPGFAPASHPAVGMSLLGVLYAAITAVYLGSVGSLSGRLGGRGRRTRLLSGLVLLGIAGYLALRTV